VLTTTSAGGGYFEYFMGTEGALKMSENPSLTRLYRENAAPEWTEWEKRGLVGKVAGPPPQPAKTIDVRETVAPSEWSMPVQLNTPIHQPHLENFFAAIRGEAKLTCPAEEAFLTEVTVIKVNEAVTSQKTLAFTDADFAV
jgi:hypothetical protein